jgi:acetyl/propionyl-CoA carboxylase alpha subunit
VPTVAVYSSADRDAPHVRHADEAVCIGPSASASSYMSPQRLLEAARLTGATAVHPGYGFLSESHEFAAAVGRAGLVFVGPPPSAIRDLGDKIQAKRLARAAGLPTIPGWAGDVATASPERALAAAQEIGWPVVVKPSRGGGGKGLRVARSPRELAEAVALSRREAQAAFGDASLLVEKYVERARHVEVQVVADAHGACVYFPERDCSAQRRGQKVLEESPSPWVARAADGGLALRRAMGEQAVRLARAVGYASAGTVEFVVDAGDGDGGKASGSSSSSSSGSSGSSGSSSSPFYFLEMNTRLQVEHPVTEAVSGGVDLVELMLRVAGGERLPAWLTQERAAAVHGAAIEARLYAEDPARGFLPSPGTLTAYREPPSPSFFGGGGGGGGNVGGGLQAGAVDPAVALAGAVPTYVRLDRGVCEGGEVPVHYDPMLGKLVAAAPTREAARRALARALDAFVVRGVATNLAAVRRMLDLPAFVSGDYDTGLIAREFGVGGMPTMAEEEDAAGGGGGGSGGKQQQQQQQQQPPPQPLPKLSALDPLAFPLPPLAEREIVAAAVLLYCESNRRRRPGGRGGQGAHDAEPLSVVVWGGSTALPRRALEVRVRPAPAAHVGRDVAATGRALEVELPDAVVHVYAAEDGEEATTAGGDNGGASSSPSYSRYLCRVVVDGRALTLQLAERPAAGAAAPLASGREVGLGPGAVSRRGTVALQHRGAQREVLVEPARVAALARHMPPPEALARRRARERGAAVRSPMTGTLAALRVQAGDRVAEGDEVAVVSAMKMMMPLLAPRPGVVAAVAEGVAVGRGVAADAVLVTLEEEEEGGDGGGMGGRG